jgi:hypothetical protein
MSDTGFDSDEDMRNAALDGAALVLAALRNDEEAINAMLAASDLADRGKLIAALVAGQIGMLRDIETLTRGFVTAEGYVVQAIENVRSAP